MRFRRQIFTLLIALALVASVELTSAQIADAPATPAPASRPAWLDQKTSDWPQILCSNEIRYQGRNELLQGGGAFLMSLPDGTVVAGTAKHLIAADISLSDYNKKIRSYVLYSHADPKKRISVGKLALDPADVANMDWAVMSLANQHGPFPTEVLPARLTPLEIGETVYLVGIPNAQKGPQNVYQGIVIARERHDFIFRIDTHLEQTAGLSGSPLLDDKGRLAAVYTGHLTEQNNPNKTDLVALDTSQVIKFITFPADKSADRNAANSTASPATQPSDPSEAALRAAQLYLDNQMFDQARDKLNDIIKKYPDTPAAKRALQLLRLVE